jgi:hypothetical protein
VQAEYNLKTVEKERKKERKKKGRKKERKKPHGKHRPEWKIIFKWITTKLPVRMCIV